MTIDELLIRAKKIWRKKQTLSEIIPCMGKVFGDICRWQRNAPKDKKFHNDYEIKKELGNMIFSTIRWCDNLGYDPKECIKIAVGCQKKFEKNKKLSKKN